MCDIVQSARRFIVAIPRGAALPNVDVLGISSSSTLLCIVHASCLSVTRGGFTYYL